MAEKILLTWQRLGISLRASDSHPPETRSFSGNNPSKLHELFAQK